MLSKKPFMIQIPNGSANAVCTRMTPTSLSYRPSVRSTTKSAMSSVTLGKLWSSRTPPRNTRRPLNRSRENA